MGHIKSYWPETLFSREILRDLHTYHALPMISFSQLIFIYLLSLFLGEDIKYELRHYLVGQIILLILLTLINASVVCIHYDGREVKIK